jgi:hypothetical protein
MVASTRSACGIAAPIAAWSGAPPRIGTTTLWTKTVIY